MITYREYCKRLNERKSKDCTIQEDWGKTSPVPEEVYGDPNLPTEFGWVDLGLPSGTLWANCPNQGLYTFEEAQRNFKGDIPYDEDLWEIIHYCKWEMTERGYSAIGKDGSRVYFPFGRTLDKDFAEISVRTMFWADSKDGCVRKPCLDISKDVVRIGQAAPEDMLQVIRVNRGHGNGEGSGNAQFFDREETSVVVNFWKPGVGRIS